MVGVLGKQNNKQAGKRVKKYVVGFTVHEAKELSFNGGHVDPLCVVRCGGQEFRTELKKSKRAHVTFEESFIWNDLEFTDEIFAMSHIEFELQSANIFTRNDVIGTCKVELAMVREKQNHSYNHKWVQMRREQSIGPSIKVSVYCYTHTDTPPRPENEVRGTPSEIKAQMENLNEAIVGDKNPGLQSAASLHRKAYHLFVHIHRCEHLGGGTQTYNPHVSVEFNGYEMQTQPAKDVHSINFDTCFRIPVMTPLVSDSIVIRVWDNKWGSNEIIVQGRLSFALLRLHALMPRWFNFYGFSPEEVADVEALLGQEDRPEENYYLGRLLVSGRVQMLEKTSQLMKEAIVRSTPLEEPPSSGVTFLLDVFEVSGCPGSEVYVQLSAGKKSKKTKVAKRSSKGSKKVSEPGLFAFDNMKGRVPEMNVVMPIDDTDQFDIMLNLYANLEPSIGFTGGMTRIGFLKMRNKDIPLWEGQNSSPKWVSLSPMAHLPSSIEPGQILFSLHRSDENIVKERAAPQVRALDFELRAYMFAARNLATESGDIPSAFVQVTCAGRQKTTKSADESISPTWREVLILDVTLQASIKTSTVLPEPIQILVYDNVAKKGIQATDIQEYKADIAAAMRDDRGKADAVLDASALDDEMTKKIGKTVGKAAGGVMDTGRAMMGDVMAKKRLGAVVNGRQLIGRASVNFYRILKGTSPNSDTMRPKWLKLRGGVLGSGHVGDILVGFQLMKKKYSGTIPIEPTAPVGKECLLSVAILGVRRFAPCPDIFQSAEAQELNRPTIVLEVSQPTKDDKKPVISKMVWAKRPKDVIGPDDFNRKWTMDGMSGFEFLTVDHLEVELPKRPIWQPTMKLKLLGDRDQFLGEGVVSLSECMPWVKAKVAKKKIAALDTFELDTTEEEGLGDVAAEGIEISDVEDVKAYIEVEIGNEPVKLAFNARDETSFPPKITWIDPDPSCPARQAELALGDWLVGYKTPTDEKEKPCAHWSPKQAATFIDQMDAKRVRPLNLRFRRKTDQERCCSVVDGSASIVLKMDDETRPPRIEKDLSKTGFWKQAGIGSGWRIVDINGFCTEEMTSQNPQFNQLLEIRPAIFTCRSFAVMVASVAEEQKAQDAKPVQLNGMPTNLVMELRKKAVIKDGFLKHSCCPRPTPSIATVSDLSQLNLNTAIGYFLDLRGVVHAEHYAQDVANAGDDHAMARPQVPGKLEDFMPAPVFSAVPIMYGDHTLALVKARVKVTAPVVKDWYTQGEHKGSIDATIFDERHFRLRFKRDIPNIMRIRTYIVRGMNISGAFSGYGNPYLYFVYGNQTVQLSHKVVMQSTEPRFYTVEEKNLSFPDQHLFEIGLRDYSEDSMKSDALIGSSVLDLEDRWHNALFQEFMHNNQVPIEYRPLSRNGVSTGWLEMWIELLHAKETAEIPPSPLFAPPPAEVEVRLVVWSAAEISMRLCETPKVDVICRCSIDSKTFKGLQPVVQDTDVHGQSDGDAEFNWRFVWSRIQVTRGVPLHCLLQVSLYEFAALSRPTMLCETLVEMRNYCNRVGESGIMMKLESDLPLANPKLAELEASPLDEFPGGGGDEFMDGSTKAKPAATVKVELQVLNQTEASSAEQSVGIGREEPNRNPTLKFPKTGRDWKATLPGTAAAFDDIYSRLTGSSSKLICLGILFVLLFAILNSITVVSELDCSLLKASCGVHCAACYSCWDRARTPMKANLCYFKFVPGFPDKCATTQSFVLACNLKVAGDCMNEDPAGIDPNAVCRTNTPFVAVAAPPPSPAS